MRIVVVGAAGQLGRELLACLPRAEVVGLTRADVDLTDLTALPNVLSAHRPDVVVNATAENRVDWVEDHIAEAMTVNAHAVEVMAQACRRLDATLLHVSTDYVFDGRQTHPYRETDAPNPQSAYARSKLAGEHAAATTARHIVLRVAGLYAHGGARGKGGSFIDKILAQAQAGNPLRVVADQVTAPTWARDVAHAIARLLPRWHAGDAPPGLYHMTNAGACSWHAFAQAIVAQAGLDVGVEPISSATLNAPAARPAYSVLANERLAAIGAPPLRAWDDALRAYLLERPQT